MIGKPIVFALLAGIAALGASFYWYNQSDDVPAAAPAAVREVASKPAGPDHHGRVFLSQEQQREALAAGQIDRPVNSLLKIEKQLKYGDFKWDDKGVGPGPTWIRVDLQNQILSVFRGGHEIGTAVILYGAESKQTPPGVYPILAKAKEHRSSIYDAEMPYTLRLTHDGIAIHASNVRWGSATHGCIGVPIAFAEKLFDSVDIHDPVTVLGQRDASRDPKV